MQSMKPGSADLRSLAPMGTDFLEKLRRRDKGAITKVVRTYTSQLYRASLGLGFSDTSADELVQSVWGTFFEVVSRYEGRSHVRTFLFGILYNKARELRRETARCEPYDAIEDLVDARFATNGSWARPPVDPEKELLASESRRLIAGCLEALSVSQRMAFVLKEVDGLSHAEICKILNLTVTNIGVVLFRARNRLRECLEGKFSKGHQK